MKKLLLITAIAGFAYACNDGSKSSTTSTDTSAMAPATTPAADSSASAKTMKDGLMMLKDGKMQILKGGTWVAMDSAMTCTNGRKVSVNGEVSKGDKKRKLEEGWKIDMD